MELGQGENSKKKISRDDAAFLLKVIGEGVKLGYFQLTPNGKAILEMAWCDKLSIPKIAKTLLLSEERVRQVYKREVRLLGFYIDQAYKDYQSFLDLKKENALLQERIKALTIGSNMPTRKTG